MIRGQVLVSDLLGTALDFMTAAALGYRRLAADEKPSGKCCWVGSDERCHIREDGIEKVFAPASNPNQGQPIAEKHRISCEWIAISGHWRSTMKGCGDEDEKITETGTTELISRMRCLVKKTFGEEVHV